MAHVVPHEGVAQEAFEATAAAFENDDFVEAVTHLYRHRFGLVEGDSAYRDIESRLAAPPKITVPSLVLEVVLMRSIHLPRTTHSRVILPGRIAEMSWKALAKTYPKRRRKNLPTGY